jgi:hypothetical protein
MTADSVVPRFMPGDRIVVRDVDSPGHVRTPEYIRGKKACRRPRSRLFPPSLQAKDTRLRVAEHSSRRRIWTKARETE